VDQAILCPDTGVSGRGREPARADERHAPVRAETQVPQPPARYQARFFADRQRVVGG
jgi:hypothetical protein